MENNIIELTKEQLEVEDLRDVINFETGSLIVLDFYKQNCGPCKVVKATLKAITLQRSDVDIYCIEAVKCDLESLFNKLNTIIDGVPGDFEVKVTPTVVFIKNNTFIGFKKGFCTSKDVIELL